jgi:Xaa-Pro dipeptidase
MLELIEAFDLVPKTEVIDRIDGLKLLMTKIGVDFAVIYQNVDKYYFTGTIQKGMLIIPVDADPLFFIEKSVERGRLESPLEVTPIKSDKEILGILRQKGVLGGVAGLELDVLPVSIFERLKRILGFERYADLSGAIKELRMVKSPFEITQIRQSGRIVSRVFEMAKQVIREGVREIDIDAALVAEGRRQGHQGFVRMRGINQEMTTVAVQAGFTGAIICYADVPIAGAGITPAIPQGSSFKKVEQGIPVTIDYGGGFNGYITDETRAFVVGELDERFQKPYECARRIIVDSLSFAKAGVDATEIFSRALILAKEAGLSDYFMGTGDGQVSFIGHGVGLEINELPVITGWHHAILKEGMVIALEPKFVLPGLGAVGIEVDFIVREQGVERVTTDSFDMVYL